MKHRRASQSPLSIHSNVLVQVKALVKDVVANRNDHERYRSEAPPGNVVHQSDMVPEGEAPPDNPEPLVLLEVQEPSSMAKRSLVDLCWRASARSLWISHGSRRARGGKRERGERGERESSLGEEEIREVDRTKGEMEEVRRLGKLGRDQPQWQAGPW